MNLVVGVDRACSPLGLAALDYAGVWGLRVLPLLVGGDVPHFRSVSRGVLDASSDPDTVRSWWRNAPKANVGVACAASGLVVLDIDSCARAIRTMARLVEALGPLPQTWTAWTPGGSAQHFYRWEGPYRELREGLGLGVSIVHWSYVVAPPSCDSAHRRYSWRYRPGNVPLSPLPASWQERLSLSKHGRPRALHRVLRTLAHVGGAS
ncbi:MAG: bifunctional DNA primase/polymerase [Polyangiaceae bacterium]|jgi:hypothetical protein